MRKKCLDIVPEILTERGNSILNDKAIFLFKYNAVSQYLKELKTWRQIYKKNFTLINYIDKIPTLHCELVLLCRNLKDLLRKLCLLIPDIVG